MVLEMSTVCRFSLLTVKELFHQCQQGLVGDQKRPNLVDVVFERPLTKADSIEINCSSTLYLSKNDMKWITSTWIVLNILNQVIWIKLYGSNYLDQNYLVQNILNTVNHSESF